MQTSSLVHIDGTNLTIPLVKRIASGGVDVKLAENVRPLVRAGREVVERTVKAGQQIYGVTTGFGRLKSVMIDPKDAIELQRNLVLSHCTGVGAPLPDDAVRASVLLRAHSLARGYSGVRLDVIDLLLEMLNRRVTPIIPSKGSVGASGDLAPLAHMALVLIGEGDATFEGKRMSGADALKAANLKPLVLSYKEGLALINGTQIMTGIGALTRVPRRPGVQSGRHRGRDEPRGVLRHRRRVRRAAQRAAAASRPSARGGQHAALVARLGHPRVARRLRSRARPVFVPLHPGGARRRARRDALRREHARHRDEFGDGQPDRHPRGRLLHHRRQLPRRTGGAGDGLSRHGAHRARLDRRAAHLQAARRSRGAAAVSVRGPRAAQRLHARAVHGCRARVARTRRFRIRRRSTRSRRRPGKKIT